MIIWTTLNILFVTDNRGRDCMAVESTSTSVQAVYIAPKRR